MVKRGERIIKEEQTKLNRKLDGIAQDKVIKSLKNAPIMKAQMEQEKAAKEVAEQKSQEPASMLSMC